MQPQVIGAQRKGYTQEEIVQQIAQDGVEISASTLRYAMQRAGKEDQSTRAERHVKTHTTTASPRGKKVSQATSSHNGHAQAGSRQKGDRGVTKTELTQVQGFLGFTIRPDTENL